MVSSTKAKEPRKKSAPSTSPQNNENRLINMAMTLAEQQLADGTASSQVITHFLKLGTEKTLLERAKLEKENRLLEAKTEQIKSSKLSQEMFAQAIEAMQVYSGEGRSDE